MKFFGIPKNAVPKSILAAGVIHIIFSLVMNEIIKAEPESPVDYNPVMIFIMCGGGGFLLLGLLAIWFPRSASVIGVALYAAFLVLQAQQGMIMTMSIMNIPMMILLIGALACAFRRTPSPPQIQP